MKWGINFCIVHGDYDDRRADHSERGMSDMTDIEIVTLCAEAMGYDLRAPTYYDGEQSTAESRLRNRPFVFNPLHDDAQAMALESLLVVKGNLHYEDGDHMFYTWPLETGEFKYSCDFTDRRRAICLCVANMQARQ